MFIIPGPPQSKLRPRIVRGGSHSYTPQKTKDYQKKVKDCYDGLYFEKKPLCVKIDLFYPIPKSTSKKKRLLILEGELRPMVKPDVDNVAKCILDALNGIAYADDNQITSLLVSKWYSDDPRAEVTIEYEY